MNDKLRKSEIQEASKKRCPNLQKIVQRKQENEKTLNSRKLSHERPLPRNFVLKRQFTGQETNFFVPTIDFVGTNSKNFSTTIGHNKA